MYARHRGKWRQAQAGVTLVELVLFIIIVSVGIAGILSVMNMTTKSSVDPMVRKQAIAIAESMMEEIMLKDFANPTSAGAFTGAPTQANRPLFDDIGDYNGFSTNGTFTVDGTAVGGLGNYNVQVSVTADGGLAGGALAVPAADSRLITVTVTGPSATSVVLNAYRTNYAP